MPRYEAVLFDWSGTLVHDPSPSDRLRRALEVLDRTNSAATIKAMLARLDDAARHPDVEEALRGEDTSAVRHRTSNTLWFERAGLDPELAEALYAVDEDPTHRPLYPDVADTLATLMAQHVKIAIVSDIHLDLRRLLERQGIAQYIDEYVLSFEHGWQKPDPRMFLTALELLGVAAGRTLMVGDRGTHDGGSVVVGIAALILPPPPPTPTRGLQVVTHLTRPVDG